MAKTYTAKCIGTDEEFTYTVYAKYMRDDYADGTKRYNENNNMARCATVTPAEDVGEGYYVVVFTDNTPEGDFFTSGPAVFNNLRDADLMARAWVTRGK